MPTLDWIGKKAVLNHHRQVPYHADGRILAVEYKNATDWTNDDSKEKRAVGELWAQKSGGKCLFVMPRGPDWGAIKAAVAPKPS